MEQLYIGIDIGKLSHAAHVMSRSLFEQHGSAYKKYPHIRFANTREGFAHLLAFINKHGSPEHCHVLVESTGHYGATLEQFLREHGVTLYRVAAHKRMMRDKTDDLDACGLAMRLYAQIELRALVPDRHEQVRILVEPIPAAKRLRGLVQTYNEMVERRTAIYNKLTAICDELFTELGMIYSDTHSPVALNLREQFPTPEDVAAAPLDALCATRTRYYPSRDALVRLQELAAHSIGTRDPDRRACLLLEQRLLICEVRPLCASIEELKSSIEAIVTATREGKILLSFIGIGAISAASLLAAIGSVANFERASRLRGFLGCAPKESQSGTSLNNSKLEKKRSNTDVRRLMFLVVSNAVRFDPTWEALYQRLVARMCYYDARRRKMVGKLRVTYRLAGQMINVIYCLLKRDYVLTSGWQRSDPLPDPELYSPEEHHVMKTMTAKSGGGRGTRHQRTTERVKALP